MANMTVTTREKAWEQAKNYIPGELIKNETASENAGYDVFYDATTGEWISDLGCRLEVNLANGKSHNIWIDDTADATKEDWRFVLQTYEEIGKMIDEISCYVLAKPLIEARYELERLLMDKLAK